MIIAPCTRTHAPEILAIFNHAILHSTALYEYEPRTPDFMTAWFDAKERANLPVLGAFEETGALLGFATYGPFRALPAYHPTAEHSVYVRAGHHRQGVGKALLRALIATARQRQIHTLVGVIDSANPASLALHASFGFQNVGILREVGLKFDRRLDVALCQLLLSEA